MPRLAPLLKKRAASGVSRRGHDVNRQTRALLVAGPTTGAWLLLIGDAVLAESVMNLSDGMSVLVATIAATGSLVLAGWARARPAADMYTMGYDAGRRQAKIDAVAEKVSQSSVVVQFRQRS